MTSTLSDASSAKQRVNSSHPTRNTLAELHRHENEAYRGENKLNIEHRDESQKFKVCLSLMLPKKVTELQNQEQSLQK